MPLPRAVAPAVLLATGLLVAAAAAEPSDAAAATAPDRGVQAAAQADALLSRALGPEGGSSRRAELVDRDGTAHVRYARTYRGLPVLGGDVVVHVTPRGTLAGLSATTPPDLRVSTRPVTTEAAAVSSALATARRTGRTTRTATSRLVVDAAHGRPALAREVVVTGTQADQTPSRLHVVVDATTGAVRGSWDEVETGTGTGLYDGPVTFTTSRNATTGRYETRDPTRGGDVTTDLKGATSGNGTRFTDADDVWGDGTTGNRATAGVDAAYGAQVTYDFFKNVLGRSGISGTGAGVRSRVHFGTAYANAFWDGTQMTYGDGAGGVHPLVSLDIAGHEMSHGVTQATAGLTFAGEPGGLNEATSDIFGTAVEFFAADPSDPGDYLIGEEVGTPLRFLDRPSRDGSSPDCWSADLGSLEPHAASGPADHAFYLMAEGSGAKTVNGVAYASPTCNGASVTPIGRLAAVRIWYRALSVYMTSSTDYAGARAAAVQAATDLYGAGSAQCAGVAAAFAAVSVPGPGCGAPAPQGGALVNGGFESGATGWTSTPGVITTAQTAAPHSGTTYAYLDGYGTAHTDTLSQTFTVPAAGGRLTYWLSISSAETSGTADDTLSVQVTSGGTTSTLAAYSNLDAGGGYVQRSASLLPYAGKTVTLTLTGTEDALAPTSFLVDDLAVASS